MSSSKLQHEEIDLLLPWYVNDTLESTERRAVDRHLATCKECTDSVAFLRKTQKAVTGESPSPIAPAPNVDGLLNRLDNEGVASKTPMRYQLVAVVALVGIALVLLLWSGQVTDPVGPEFRTVTSDTPTPSMAYVFDVTLDPTLEREEQIALLDSMGATNISSGQGAGQFRVSLHAEVASLEALEALAAEIGASEQVLSIEPVAMQLPLRDEP